MKFVICCLLLAVIAAAAAEPSTTCNCGWVNRGRLVGGKGTLKNEYPWMVSIMVGWPFSQHHCGGSIITPWHILTAAHCIDHLNGRSVYVSVGADNIHSYNLVWFNNNYEIGTIYTNNWNTETGENDIAIFETKSEIQFNQNVGPACLPKGKMNFEGEMLRVIGWGLTEDQGSISKKLLFLDLDVMPMNECKKIWGSYEGELPTQETNICTFKRNKGTCQGDSGGPLIWYDQTSQRYILAGLVSFGGAVCADDMPSVNFDVSAYIDWIKYVVSKSDLGTQVCTPI